MRSWSRTALQQAANERRANADQGEKGACDWNCQCRYTVEASLLDAEFTPLVITLAPDNAAEHFIQLCQNSNPLSIIASVFLRFFYSSTNANGITGTGSMHIFSTEQVEHLLRESLYHLNATGKLLDIGAGDGNVTKELAPLFSSVCTTEMSSNMIGRLQQRGFDARLTTDPSVFASDAPFDVVSCLNVLDRCSHPLSLLRQIRSLLRPESGRLLLAIVFPFRPGVENGSSWESPDEELPPSVKAIQFEQALSAFVKNVLEKQGFEVLVVSRIPYLSCSVSLTQNYALLDNALFVCRTLSQ